MSTGIMVPAPPFVSPKATVSAQAATATLPATIQGKQVTNTGATGTITLTLPAASSMAGTSFRVQMTVAQIARLAPASGDAVCLGGSNVDDKYLQIAGVIGNYADIYCDGVDYMVVRYSGVLTKEA